MIEIVPYKGAWPNEFLEIGQQIRAALGDSALAIHHIGSTSVPGLDAKDIIDIQVSVAELSDSVAENLVAAGFSMTKYRTDHCPPGMSLSESDLAKMLFGGPGRKSHIHVRIEGRFNQRYPLLCREYLRSHEGAANAYAEIKRQLARYFPDNVNAYYDIKDPVFDVIMTGANEWVSHTDWKQPSSDV